MAPMLLKAGRTTTIFDMGGFIVHVNMPGRLMPGSSDHGLGPLASVIESILHPGRLIKLHEHRNDEIISWVPDGVMRHNDKTVGELVTDADHLMVMNAGRTFWHSEETLASDPHLRMLQIFVRPHTVDLEPNIQHGSIAAASANTWRHLFGPEGTSAPFFVRNDVDFFDIRIAAGTTVALPERAGWDAYFYVFTGEVSAEGETFVEGEQGLLEGGGPLEVHATEATTMVAFLVNMKATITREGTVGH